MASETGDADDLTFTVTGPDGDEESVTLPAALVDALSEEGEPPETTVADITLMAFVGRAHHLVHHGHEDFDADLETAEERALELFEERFGVTYAEATGHDH